MFSESRSQAQHNVYFGYINIEASDFQITFHTTDEAVKADITIKDYEMPTLKADGQPIEIPVNLSSVSTMDGAVYKFKVDSSVIANSYKVNVTKNFKGTEANLRLYFSDTAKVNISKTKFNGGTISITSENLSGNDGYAFIALVAISNNDDYNFIYPVTITLTAASS